MKENNLFIRRTLSVFISCLVISGLTAIPIESLLSFADNIIIANDIDNTFTQWVHRVYMAVRETNIRYPFMSYGTDWLAFAHLMIAVAFIGPLKNPVRNIWVVEFGLIACISIIPFAFIAGAVRSIPIYWRMIDCSFGLFGGLLLLSCYYKIKKIEQKKHEAAS